MSSNNLTFVLFAFNEEKRIEYPIRNFIQYGKVIVIDNYSTDKTREIATSLWATVYEYKNNWYVETPEELEFVKSKVETDYMTWSFTDHMWPKKLLEKTIEITQKGEYDGITAVQKNYHYGIRNLTFSTYGYLWKFVEGGRWIVAKKEMYFATGFIHSSMQNKSKTVFHMPMEDDYVVHHLSLYNIKKFEMAHSNYSDIEAKHHFDVGSNHSIFWILGKLGFYFIQYYFVNGAWKSGKPGFIFVMQYMFFFFNCWAKEWELRNNITLESIEENYNTIRREILSDINH